VAQAGRRKKLRSVPGKGAEISRRGVAEWDGDAYRPKGLHLAKPRGSTRGGRDQTNELLPKKRRREGERERRKENVVHGGSGSGRGKKKGRRGWEEDVFQSSEKSGETQANPIRQSPYERPAGFLLGLQLIPLLHA
jgi:hypothetical protein